MIMNERSDLEGTGSKPTNISKFPQRKKGIEPSPMAVWRVLSKHCVKPVLKKKKLSFLKSQSGVQLAYNIYFFNGTKRVNNYSYNPVFPASHKGMSSLIVSGKSSAIFTVSYGSVSILYNSISGCFSRKYLVNL